MIKELQRMQAEYGYLPEDKLLETAEKKGIPVAELIGSASFYEFFHFDPNGDKDHIENIYPCRKKGPVLNPEEHWAALKKAKADPDNIIPILKEAGLLGRSGSGFPTGLKWESSRNADSDVKYVVCNADEGEPGTGKDRVLITSNPSAIIEGMAICAAAVNSTQGYIYLRGEYADLKEALEAAIASAPLEGFTIEVRLGMGAYVCGEETALINSLESKRGETRLKPPYPGVMGLYQKPTVVNNAETFANVPYVINGSFKDTRLFTVSGCVNAPGVYELTPGLTLAELVEIAGGASEPVRAVQSGGGSGNIIPYAPDMVMTPKGCIAGGATFGTGAVRLYGESENLVAEVRKLTAFYAKESCGTCTPCRVGLMQLVKMLESFEAGDTYPESAEQMRELCEHIRISARCALAPAAISPAVSLLNHFPEVLK